MPAYCLNCLSHPPLSQAKPKGLVVLLHGLGADGKDLLSLAPYWAPAMPEVQFYAPDAPQPCDMAPMGFQWFSLQDRSPARILEGVEAASPLLNGFLDEILEEHGLEDEALALVGFSQGSMMALHVAPRRAEPVAGVIGFSGMMVAREQLAAASVSKPPILLIHGTADDVVPFTAMEDAESSLRQAGFSVESLTRPDLGHGIDDLGLVRAGQFLSQSFSATIVSGLQT